MRSAWRGEARNTSMPKRLRSKSAAPTAIISMAQQASPKVTGHMLMRLAHLTRSSSRPVRKLCWRSSRPMARVPPSGRPARFGPDVRHRRLRRPLGKGQMKPLDGPPVEGAVGDEVHERDEHDGGEHADLDE